MGLTSQDGARQALQLVGFPVIGVYLREGEANEALSAGSAAEH